MTVRSNLLRAPVTRPNISPPFLRNRKKMGPCDLCSPISTPSTEPRISKYDHSDCRHKRPSNAVGPVKNEHDKCTLYKSGFTLVREGQRVLVLQPPELAAPALPREQARSHRRPPKSLRLITRGRREKNKSVEENYDSTTQYTQYWRRVNVHMHRSIDMIPCN